MDIRQSTIHSKHIAAVLMAAGFGLLAFMAAALLCQSLLFLAGISLTVISLVVGAVAGLATTWLAAVSAGLGRKQAVLLCLAIMLLVAMAVWVSGWLYDLSWDGRDYHQRAISTLAGGWNPVIQFLTPESIYYNVWLNHYPKAPWVLSALLYSVTGTIESGKSINLLMMASLFFLGCALFLELGLGKLKSIVLGALLALNPVTVSQAWTNYVDGLVATALSLFFVLVGFTWLRRLPRWILVVSWLAFFCIGLNIKATATVYLGILAAGTAIAWLIYRRKQALPELVWMGAAIMVAIGVVGFNPYLTNLISGKNPLYPTLGESQYDLQYVVQNQMPSNYKSMSGIEKALHSIFAPSQNVFGKTAGPVKIPFYFSLAEVRTFADADTRVAGWGPWFSGALVLSMILSLFLAREKTKLRAVAGVFLALLLLTLAVNSEAWWARYAPQMWLIPLVVLVFTWLAGVRRARWLSYALAGVLLVNVMMVAGANLYSNIQSTREMNAHLVKMKASLDEVFVYYGPLEMTEITLKKAGIQYRVVSSLDALDQPIPLSPGVFYAMRRKP